MVYHNHHKKHISFLCTFFYSRKSSRKLTSTSSQAAKASCNDKNQTFDKTQQPFTSRKDKFNLFSHWRSSLQRILKPQISTPTKIFVAQGHSISGSMEVSLVDSPKIKLRDGRYLAYKERGVPKMESKFKIILVHGFGSSKEMNFNASQDVIEELGIYFLLYDRAGYGESDPNPKRSVKSEALDIEELADQLQIGSKFYVIGVSMGSYPTWSCLKHIPHRLLGVAFVAPVVNYRWRFLPKKLIRKDYRRGLIKWSFRISRYAPGLVHWWIIQKLFPAPSSVLESNRLYFNSHDIEVLKRTTGFPMLTKERLRERSVFDTLRNDFVVGFGNWDFDPADLTATETSVHIWHGYEDRVVPFQLQRCILKKLPWIKYHEIPEGGHLIVHYEGISDAVLRGLLVGEELTQYTHIEATAES